MNKKVISFMLTGLLLLNTIAPMTAYGLTNQPFYSADALEDGDGTDGPEDPDTNNLEDGEINNVNVLDESSTNDIDRALENENVSLKNKQELDIDDIKAEMKKIEEERDAKYDLTEDEKNALKAQDFKDAVVKLRTDAFFGDDPSVKSEQSNYINQIRNKLEEFGVKNTLQGYFGAADFKNEIFNFSVRAWDKANTVNDLESLSNQSEDKVNEFLTDYLITLQQEYDDRSFETNREDAYDPSTSAGTKILENVSDRLGKDTGGILNIYVEQKPTQVDREVYSQFADKHPNVDINIYYNYENTNNYVKEGYVDEVNKLSESSKQDIQNALSKDTILLKNGQELSVDDIKDRIDGDVTPEKFEEAVVEERTEQQYADDAEEEANLQSTFTAENSVLHQIQFIEENMENSIMIMGQSFFSGNTNTHMAASESIPEALGDSNTPENIKTLEDNGVVMTQAPLDRVFETKPNADVDKNAVGKLLENTADLLDGDEGAEIMDSMIHERERGITTVYSESKLTGDELSVISQFMDRYPEVEVEIYVNEKNE